MHHSNPEKFASLGIEQENSREREACAEEKRVLELMDSMDERRAHLLSAAASKQLEIIQRGAVRPGSLSIVESGVSDVERVVYELPGTQESMVAYRKPALGEEAFRWLPEAQILESRRFDLVTGAVSWRQCTASTPEGEKWLKIDLETYSRRSRTDRQTREQLAADYGVPVEAIDLEPEVMGSRLVSPGHGVLAEAAASVLAAAIGYDDAAVVTIHSDERGLMAVSGHIAGEMIDFVPVATGPDGTAKRSFIRAAMFADVIKETDEHGGNLRYDADTETFKRFDFGCALGYSRHTAEGAVPVDLPTLMSGEIMASVQELELDEEMRQKLREVALECRAFQTATAKGEAVDRDFPRAALIRDSFRLVFEMSDGDGRSLEGSDRVAKIEADDFVARLEHWATTGRPSYKGEYDKCLGSSHERMLRR